MDWLDLLEVQGTLKSLLQHHSSKASTAIIRMYFCFGIWSFCYSFKMKNYAIILLSRIANVSDVTQVVSRIGSHFNVYLLQLICQIILYRYQSNEKLEKHIQYLLLLLLLLLSHFSRVRLCATPQTSAHQAPPPLGFSRQEHWSGLPFPSPIIQYMTIY